MAIDGPSGSGKSSTSRGVADRLGLRYLDTGAMYRAMTWWMLRQGVDVHDPSAVAARVEEPEILSGTDPLGPTILVDGIDVGLAIRSDEVNAAVSPVSTGPRGPARGCSSCSATSSATAGSWSRAATSARSSRPTPTSRSSSPPTPPPAPGAGAAEEGGPTTCHRATREALLARDQIDSGRATSPLVMAEGAVHVDGTAYTLDEVVGLVVALVEKAASGAAVGERVQ